MNIVSLTVNEFDNGLRNVITFISWEVDGIKGTTKLNPPKEVFKPLDQVSKEDLVSWVYAKDAKKIAQFKANKKATQTVAFGEVPEPSEKAIADMIAWATARLTQYKVSEGRPEIKEMQPIGEQVFNETTGEMEDVLEEVVVQTAIEPVEPTVEVTEYDEEGNATTTTIENPVITQDNLERAEATQILETYA